jgi:RNA polymerase sigma-70 factor (ECF subfamily)
MEDAEETTDDTFLKCWNCLPELKRTYAFKKWLYKIHDNNIMIRRRKMARMRSMGKRYTEHKLAFIPLPDDIAASRTPITDYQTKLKLEKAYNLIAQLTPKQQRVFTLRRIQGLSIKETAETLDMTEGQVKMAFKRACRKIKPLENQNNNNVVGF